MKSALILLGVLGVGISIASMAGCQTDSPGATNTLGTYSTMVDSTPDKVTAAAQKAATDMSLSEIVANGTKVDGKVTAKNAHGDVVSIDIAQAGDNVSKVSIRVGETGDDAVSKQLIDRIKSHLGWF